MFCPDFVVQYQNRLVPHLVRFVEPQINLCGLLELLIYFFLVVRTHHPPFFHGP